MDGFISSEWTVNPGELYIVEVNEHCYLYWEESEPPKQGYVKEKTDYFIYEEKLDYMAINVDTVYGDTTITEIGVFDGEECLGASKVHDSYPVQILAYTPEGSSRGNGLQFRLYSGGGRNSYKKVNNYTAYDKEVSSYLQKSVYYDRDDFVTVRLHTENAPHQEVGFALMNNYPNPVNIGITTISFAPAKDAGHTEIKIFNIKGRLVRKFDCDDEISSGGVNGRYNVTWNGKDNSGNKVSSGIYFYKLISGKKSAAKKMVIIN